MPKTCLENLFEFIWNLKSTQDLKLHFQISKLDFRFQINSNGFSRHRIFGHKCVSCCQMYVEWVFSLSKKNCCACNKFVNNKKSRRLNCKCFNLINPNLI
jgi:hypothetical protein